MAERLIQTLSFVNIPAGGSMLLAHSINIHDVPQKPDFVAFDAPGFSSDPTTDVTDTTIRVHNNNLIAGSVIVWLELKHSIQRAFGGVQNTSLVPRPFVVADGGGGSGSASSLLAIYGNGNNGDHTTAGDEQWITSAPPPGSPVLPVSPDPIPFVFFNNLTISAGDSVAVGGFTDELTENGIVLFIKETLIIGAGGRIHVNGGDAAPSTVGGAGTPGLGRKAILSAIDGGNGAQGQLGPGNGAVGIPSGEQPAFSWATMSDVTGGKGGKGGVQVGGISSPSGSVSWPYSLSHAISIASLLFTTIGGGNGGGAGGAGSNGDFGGSGGGGAGTLVIFARKIIAPTGSLQAIGGAGNVGFSTEGQVGKGGGGGGGGCGGTIYIVTDEISIVGICDASGGAGGTVGPDSGDATVGTTGNPGAIIAINPMLGPIAI